MNIHTYFVDSVNIVDKQSTNMPTVITEITSVTPSIISGVQNLEINTSAFDSSLIFKLSDLSISDFVHVTRLEDLVGLSVELDMTETAGGDNLSDCVVYKVEDFYPVDDVELDGMHPEFYQIDRILNEIILYGSEYKDILGKFESIDTVSGFKFYVRKDRLYPLLGTYKLNSSNPDIETRERKFNYTDSSILQRAYIRPLMYSKGDVMDRYTLESGEKRTETYPGGVSIAESVDLRITRNMVHDKWDRIARSNTGRSSAEAAREAYDDYVDMMNDYNISRDG